MSGTIERTLIHKGAKFDFERVTVTRGDGRVLQREVVRHPGAVCVLGVLGDGRIVMIRNFRIALEAWSWELPAGTLEAGEDPAHCAGRELEEETGYRAESIVPLGTFHTTPGMTDEVMHAFAATGLVKTAQDLEEDERIEVREMTVGEAYALMDAGDLRDGKSMLTLALAARRGIIAEGGREPG
ncbi:MAG: NUDIX hydrolase [Phycisphaerales bacterium]